MTPTEHPRYPFPVGTGGAGGARPGSCCFSCSPGPGSPAVVDEGREGAIGTTTRRLAGAAGAGAIAAMCSLCAPIAGEAQESRRFHVGGGWAAGLLMGNASNFLDGGGGPWASVAWRRTSGAGIGAAVTVERLRLGDDTSGASGARARNTLLFAGAGPTAGVWLGPVRPWGEIVLGLMSGRWSTEWLGQERHGRSSAFAWGGGAGVEVRLSGGRHPVTLGGEARATKTGALSFARAQVLERLIRPTGLIAWDLVLVSLRAGVRVGL